MGFERFFCVLWTDFFRKDVIMSNYKYCVVPLCTSTTKSAPEKRFFSVPRSEDIRKSWMEKMRRKDPVSSKSNVYCCEDHFDVNIFLLNIYFLQHYNNAILDSIWLGNWRSEVETKCHTSPISVPAIEAWRTKSTKEEKPS